MGTYSWWEIKLFKSDEERQQERQESKREDEKRKNRGRGTDDFTGGNCSGSAGFEFRPRARQTPLIIYIVFVSSSRRILKIFFK
jgi:hypothetical protein